MKPEEIIKELRQIQRGIDGDNFTFENIERLIQKLQK